jgi:hypothetical protein
LSTGSTPTYSGRIRVSNFFNGVIEHGQPTAGAISGAGIRGQSLNSARTCGSNASATEPLGARSYRGGRSEPTPPSPCREQHRTPRVEVGTRHDASQHPNRDNDPVTFVATSV